MKHFKIQKEITPNHFLTYNKKNINKIKGILFFRQLLTVLTTKYCLEGIFRQSFRPCKFKNTKINKIGPRGLPWDNSVREVKLLRKRNRFLYIYIRYDSNTKRVWSMVMHWREEKVFLVSSPSIEPVFFMSNANALLR